MAELKVPHGSAADSPWEHGSGDFAGPKWSREDLGEEIHPPGPCSTRMDSLQCHPVQLHALSPGSTQKKGFFFLWISLG